MDRRRGDLEVAPHVGLGGRLAHDAGIGVDEGEVLALPIGEAGFERGVAIFGRATEVKLLERRWDLDIIAKDLKITLERPGTW